MRFMGVTAESPVAAEPARPVPAPTGVAIVVFTSSCRRRRPTVVSSALSRSRPCRSIEAAVGVRGLPAAARLPFSYAILVFRIGEPLDAEAAAWI